MSRPSPTIRRGVRRTTFVEGYWFTHGIFGDGGRRVSRITQDEGPYESVRAAAEVGFEWGFNTLCVKKLVDCGYITRQDALELGADPEFCVNSADFFVVWRQEYE